MTASKRLEFDFVREHPRIAEPAQSLRAIWPQCPRPLSDIVGKMMQKDPDDRQQDHEELLGDLRKAHAMSGGHPASAPKVRPEPASAPAPSARPGSAPAGSGDGSSAYEIDADLAASAGSASKVSVDSGYIPMEDLHRSGTYEIDSKIDASAGAALPLQPGHVWPGTDPAADDPPSGTYEIEADLGSSVRPGQPAAPAPALPGRSGTKAPPPSDPVPAGELRLVPPVHYDSKPPAGPIIFPPNSPGPDVAHQPLPLGKIAIVLLVVIGALFYYLSYQGKKLSVAALAGAPDDSADAPSPTSEWRDWMIESRRDGYFLYHRELTDHQVEVTFQKRAATVTNNTFRNGKLRVHCTVPPANSPSDRVQFYVRQTRDARGFFRRYEAYFTRDGIVFALNDSAQGAREITHWTIGPLPPVPQLAMMEIETEKNRFTVSFNNTVVGAAKDDTLSGAGTFGVDAPAETHLLGLSFMDLDPPDSAAPSSSAPAKQSAEVKLA